jgi:hypothetical protein
MNLIGTIVVYVGLLALLVGGLSILRPLTFLGLWSRGQGVMLLVGGVAVFLIGAHLPASEKRAETQATRLDELVPAFEFQESHSILIQAPQERVAEAIHEVTPREIALFRALTWIRRGGRSGKESILNPPPDEPVLSVALRTNFLKLAEDGDREIVLGTLVAAPREWRPQEEATPETFKELTAPGFALAAINFRTEDLGNGTTLLTTETRVHATDADSRRRFAAYWRVIYPGSALLRVTWLRAIRARAERPNNG